MNTKNFTKKLRASARTKQVYGQNIDRFFRWLDGKDPTPENAQEYIDYLESQGKAPNTIAVVANALRAYFKTQRENIALDAPKVQMGEPKYRTMDEVYKLLEAARTPLETCLIRVTFDSGCRIGEVLNIELPDIDWNAGFIRVTRKGGRVEDVNISQKALQALKEWLEARKGKHQRVFMDLTYQDAWQILKGLAKRAGVENFTPHQLRHSRAIQMLDSGSTLHDVQRHLGHQNIATTANIYGRLRPADLKKRIPDW